MNRKVYCLVSAPIDTYSGYGARSRDFVLALIEAFPEWDIKVVSQRWGNTRFGYLRDHKLTDLASRIITQANKQPEVWIQITVPNEFQKVGKYNIGVTAGIETTLCSGEWLIGVNKMDLVLTSSDHAKNVFMNTKWSVQDNNTKEITGTIQANTNIQVLFEGVDTSTYYPIKKRIFETSIVESLNSIPESFCFLTVGHWLQGDIGHDRKNIGLGIKKFLETFKNKQDRPALILKTSGATTSITDQQRTLDSINFIKKQVPGALPNIYLLHGDLPESEMNQLYNHPKVKAFYMITKGEGYGRPMAEFAAVGKPIITTPWSGHLDFLHKDYTCWVNGGLEDVHPSAVQEKVILKESKWFQVDQADVERKLKDVKKNYKDWKEKATRQGFIIKSQYSFDNMTEKLKSILELELPDFPQEVPISIPTLNLPTLKRIDNE